MNNFGKGMIGTAAVLGGVYMVVKGDANGWWLIVAALVFCA